MKSIATILCLLLSSTAIFAQNGYWLVRLTPKQQTVQLNIETLNQFANNYFDSTIAFSMLDDGSGIIIIKSESRSWDATWENYTLFTSPLTINYNVLCKIAKEGMPLTGTFVQYNTHITKFNVQQVPQLQNEHYNYLKRLKNIGSVLLEGHFNNDDGGLMLVDGSIEKEVIYADLTIQSGFIVPEIKRANYIRSLECK